MEINIYLFLQRSTFCENIPSTNLSLLPQGSGRTRCGPTHHFQGNLLPS